MIANTGAASPGLWSHRISSVFQTREQDPLDPNQQLMAPAWWLATSNANFPLTISNRGAGS